MIPEPDGAKRRPTSPVIPKPDGAKQRPTSPSSRKPANPKGGPRSLAVFAETKPALGADEEPYSRCHVKARDDSRQRARAGIGEKREISSGADGTRTVSRRSAPTRILREKTRVNLASVQAVRVM